jgi:hypothetical protein
LNKEAAENKFNGSTNHYVKLLPKGLSNFAENAHLELSAGCGLGAWVFIPR